MGMQIIALTPDFAVSPQLLAEDFAWVSAQGFKTLINNRPDGEGGDAQPTSQALEETARAAGLQGVSLWQTVRQQQAFRLLQQDALLAGLFWMQLLFALGVNAFYEFYPLWLVEFAGLGSSGIAWVTAGLCLMMSLASTVSGKRGLHHDPLRQARKSAVIFALGNGFIHLRLGQTLFELKQPDRAADELARAYMADGQAYGRYSSCYGAAETRTGAAD